MEEIQEDVETPVVFRYTLLFAKISDIPNIHFTLIVYFFKCKKSPYDFCLFSFINIDILLYDIPSPNELMGAITNDLLLCTWFSTDRMSYLFGIHHILKQNIRNRRLFLFHYRGISLFLFAPSLALFLYDTFLLCGWVILAFGFVFVISSTFS